MKKRFICSRRIERNLYVSMVLSLIACILLVADGYADEPSTWEDFNCPIKGEAYQDCSDVVLEVDFDLDCPIKEDATVSVYKYWRTLDGEHKNQTVIKEERLEKYLLDIGRSFSILAPSRLIFVISER